MDGLDLSLGEKKKSCWAAVTVDVLFSASCLPIGQVSVPALFSNLLLEGVFCIKLQGGALRQTEGLCFHLWKTNDTGV